MRARALFPLPAPSISSARVHATRFAPRMRAQRLRPCARARRDVSNNARMPPASPGSLRARGRVREILLTFCCRRSRKRNVGRRARATDRSLDARGERLGARGVGARALALAPSRCVRALACSARGAICLRTACARRAKRCESVQLGRLPLSASSRCACVFPPAHRAQPPPPARGLRSCACGAQRFEAHGSPRSPFLLFRALMRAHASTRASRQRTCAAETTRTQAHSLPLRAPSPPPSPRRHRHWRGRDGRGCCRGRCRARRCAGRRHEEGTRMDRRAGYDEAHSDSSNPSQWSYEHS